MKSSSLLILSTILISLFNSGIFVTGNATISCEDVSLHSDQSMLITSDKVLCGISMDGNSSLTIKDVGRLDVLKKIELKDNSRLYVLNSTINLGGEFLLKDNSQANFNKSNINLISLINFITLTEKSKLELLYSQINSNNTEIELKNLSNLNTSYSIFKGKIYIKPYSYTELNIKASQGFNLIISNQIFNATVYNSTFTISVEILSTTPVKISIPRGFYYQWNSSNLSDSFLTPARLKVYNSYLNPPGIIPELRLISKTSITINNSTNLKIVLFDSSNNITNLFVGMYQSKTFKVSDSININLINSEIIKWALYFESLTNVKITNSSNIDLYLLKNVNLYAFNVRNIENIFAKDNATLTLEESAITKEVILMGNAKLIAKNTFLNSLNEVLVLDNAVAYIASIYNINYTTKNNVTAFNVEGAVAVISGKNSSLKYFQLQIAIIKKYPKFSTLMIGFDNREGTIATFSLNNLPTADYELRLVMQASDGFELIAQRNLHINTPIQPSAPPSPVLTVTISGYPVLSWKTEENPFITILGYKIYRGEEANNLKLITTLLPNQTFFIDFNTTKDKDYYYVITAFNEYGESPFSNIIHVKIISPQPKEEQFLIYFWIPILAIASLFIFLAGYFIKHLKIKKST